MMPFLCYILTGVSIVLSTPFISVRLGLTDCFLCLGCYLCQYVSAVKDKCECGSVGMLHLHAGCVCAHVCVCVCVCVRVCVCKREKWESEHDVPKHSFPGPRPSVGVGLQLHTMGTPPIPSPLFSILALT